MSVLLPNNAKYAFFIDDNRAFHHEWDVNWSLTYKLTSIEPGEQYGFCTFLTKTPNISSFLLGHYMGFFKNLSSINGEVAIAFDSTGLFALSSNNYPYGVPKNNVKPNSLIIRDVTGVIYNETLSSFPIKTYPIETDTEITLRFRYVNKSQIVVEYRTESDSYSEIIRMPITTNLSNNDKLYPTFFYTTPISSPVESTDVTFYLKNFHVQGNVNNPTYS
jgi:hypothetical protein